MALTAEEINDRLKGRVVGIDVSKWQIPGELWAKAPPEILSWCVLKASQHNFVDSRFHEHLQNARSFGLVVGAYHFLDKRSDAATQVDAYLRAIKSNPVDFDVCDLEGVSDWPTSDAAASRALEWMERVEAATGRRPILYTSERHLKHVSTHLATRLGEYKLWAVSYWKNCPPGDATPRLTKAHSDWCMWQWCSDNLLPDLNEGWFKGHRLDTNFFNGTIDDLRALAGGNAPSSRPVIAPTVAFEAAWDYNRDRHTESWRFHALVDRMLGAGGGWGSRESILSGVAAWQLAHGLDADGMIGEATLAALDAE